MNRPRLLGAVAPALLGAMFFVSGSHHAEAAGAPLQASCHLNSPGNQIKRIVHLTFDNVHLRRDNPNVPSDLEFMPNLLNFMLNNGTVSGNHFTPLISHTATDILTAQTGVYGERMGIPIANSYGEFVSPTNIQVPSSFLYWTAKDPDGTPHMLTPDGKTFPAPWAVFTKAGCDVGGFSVANIEFERAPDDITTFFGVNSPPDLAVKQQLISLSITGATHSNTTVDVTSGSTAQVVDGMVITGSGIPANTTITSHTATALTLSQATTSSLASVSLTFQNPANVRQQPTTDYLGIAVHCALNSPLCNNPFGVADTLDDEPGGYNGFKGLFGHINVKPVISPSSDIADLDGNVIADAFGRPGFPNAFSPTATQGLGYVAQMLEAGVPVVYLYIADAHDNRSGAGTFGPGEQQYVQQLQQYDVAFGKFFQRLAQDGIDKTNTLFVITADENDHFVGGTPTPSNCNGQTVFCTYGPNQKGEITTYIDRLLAQLPAPLTFTSAFTVHNDDAPNFYVRTQPAPTDALTRQFVKALDAVQVPNPISGGTDKLSVFLADPAEMTLLHMITSDAKRTPTVTMFANDNYFVQRLSGSTACTANPLCVSEVNPAFAWNHGDFQQDITRGWFGMVGPGVPVQGRNDSIFSDHTDLRPTMMALVGLKDTYVHDGRVMVEKLDTTLLPATLRSPYYRALADIHKQLTAPLGNLGLNSLVYANKNILKDDATYQNTYLPTISQFTNSRNALDAQIVTLLNGAAFLGQPIPTAQATSLIGQARAMITQMQNMAATP